MNEGRIFPDLLRRYLPILTGGGEYSRRTRDARTGGPQA